ncbi:S8 family peptidase [Sinanaerobacter chloroacetimidivorans]|uniref:S8 family peptidase n=1 Tax=Sinanaerobacter chloroacetimidivorans TaxID=2818044 RepID=A0A8J7W2M8_9FIRM|nr:S8 family peptidase [Sinanaerobacter chloroacetimidivorans]MBR0599772.1 S8 family peptidase [Sinanaerobacter chloroacetimidivorans]
MSNERRDHLWIPDEEVVRLDKTLTARPAPRNVSYAEHGQKLSHSLQSIKQTIDSVATDDSLIDSGLMIFKVELPTGEKIKDKKDLFLSTGMQVKAVKNENKAVIATTKMQFQSLKKRVDDYTRSGAGKTYFDFIEDFKPYAGSEKNSSALQKTTCSDAVPPSLDIQIMLVPNLGEEVNGKAMKRLIDKISVHEGSIQEQPYYLSDNTPVIRAIIPSSSLIHYENDSAIYRIEETDFFSADAASKNAIDLNDLELDEDVLIDNLPIVTVLDSGVNFPNNLKSLILEHWMDSGSVGGDSEHGTKVASRVAFKYICNQLPCTKVVPRTRIIDCSILDGSVPVNIFIKRIQNAVHTFCDISKVYNLSANAASPIEGDEMSILGYELDALQLKLNVQFVVSSGNHQLWSTESSLEDVLDDDDSRVSAPADSMLSIVVGAISGETHPNSLSSVNEITSYSRRGPGFNGFSKPDVTAYGGSITCLAGSVSVPEDRFSLLLDKNGKLTPDAGTSFTAPVVAGDFAEILGITPNQDILLAKALLYHNTQPIWEEESITDEELAFAHNLYGRGLSNVDESKYSSPSKVTFLRTGTLNKVTKERVTFFMPEILAAQVGRNVAKVSVTCVSMPPVDRTKGTEYLGAYVRASLKKGSSDGRLKPVQQDFKEGRQKWDVCHQFTKLFSKFEAGDWQIWLELFSRWDEENIDVPYALAVTIEDVSNTLDVYSEIEALNRYRSINTLRLRVDA